MRLIDLVPTVLDLLDIKQKKNMEGSSLLSYIKGESCLDAQYAFSGPGRIASIRSQGWKLIYYQYADNFELYNLKNDPSEMHNLIDQEIDTFINLKQRLFEFLSKAKLGQAERKRQIMKYYSNTQNIKPLDEEMIKKLKSLGYAE